MLTMTADRWIFLFALCFKCVSANDDWYYEDSCAGETHTLSASLGSSVLLPCYYSNNTVDQVSWVHVSGSDLVQLTSKGRIKFLDPRFGRVKAFPNQGSRGNYSIYIDDLKTSDLGCYRCKQGTDYCIQVELVAEKDTLSKESVSLLYICVGVAAFILLIVSSYCCKKLCWNNTTVQYNVNIPVSAGTQGASAPPVEAGRGQVDGRQRGADNLVYENDDHDPALQGDPNGNHRSLSGVVSYVDMTQCPHNADGIYPNLNPSNYDRMEGQRTKQRFHRELFNRLRQASLSRHHYVNQDEIRRQQAMSVQGANPSRDCGYKNPIYNRSTDQLNHL